VRAIFILVPKNIDQQIQAEGLDRLSKNWGSLSPLAL